MKLLWVTDPHLTHMKPKTRADAIDRLRERKADVFVVTGDIAESHTLDTALDDLKTVAPKFYYVLGNHDYYHSTITRVRAQLGEEWLPNAGVVRLSEDTCLLGNDGWYDGRNGDYFGSGVCLTDFDVIVEFRGLLPTQRLRVMQHIADDSVERARIKIRHAVTCGYKHIFFATHVAPFEGAAWHLGAPSTPDFQPFFSSKAMGDMLIEEVGPDSVAGCRAAAFQKLTVLCGHSHSPGTFSPTPKIEVLTGAADYGRVIVAGEFEIDTTKSPSSWTNVCSACKGDALTLAVNIPGEHACDRCGNVSKLYRVERDEVPRFPPVR